MIFIFILFFGGGGAGGGDPNIFLQNRPHCTLKGYDNNTNTYKDEIEKTKLGYTILRTLAAKIYIY